MGPDWGAVASPARRGFDLAGDLRLQLFGAIFGLGTIHHEWQFILEQPLWARFWGNYMERWSLVQPTIGWPSEVGIALHLVNLLLGVLLLVLPWRRALLILLAVSFSLAQLASPARIPSHNSLMLGALAVVLSLGVAEAAERAGQRGSADAEATDWSEWTVIGLRWLCALTYLFAAFHKLNWEFLSLATSPAPPFVSQFLEPFGVRDAALMTPLGYLAIYGTVAIEVSLPLLLMIRRTRQAGCLLGAVFHLAMMTRGVIDFPAVILAFYPLFMTVGEIRALVARFLARPSPARVVSTILIAGLGAAALTTSIRVDNLHLDAPGLSPLVIWADWALVHATFVFFVYATVTVGAWAVDRRSDRAVAARG